MTDQEPGQLPEEGDDGDGEEEVTPPETEEPGEPSEPSDSAPPLATDPVLPNAVDVPGLGRPVDAGAADAIYSAQGEALAAQEAQQQST